jgi:hypothetical protein
MASGPDQKDLRRSDFVDQEPVRLDMALPDTLPFTGQLVRSISSGNLTVLGKQFDHGDEFLDVLAAALLSLEIDSELLLLDDLPHIAMSIRTHFLCPARYGIGSLKILACPCVLDRAPC